MEARPEAKAEAARAALLSEDALRHRHENRQALLSRLAGVRERIGELEREVSDIECLVRGLPYDPGRPQTADVLTKSRNFSFAANAAAGGFALPAAFVLVHPLDTIRTQMQASLAGGDLTPSAVSRRLGLSGLARGLLPSVLWASPQGALRLGVYEASKREAFKHYGHQPMLCVTLSAIVGDFASSFVKVPRELITQRLQAGQYTSGFAVARHILRTEGMQGFFRGYLSTALRDTPFMVLLFCSYEQFKLWKIRVTIAEHGPAQVFMPWSGAETVLWGGVSGALAAFLTTPFDVIKTRIMVDERKLRMSEALRSIGFQGLLAGAAPRSLWWFCVCSVFFATFERARVAVQDTIDAQ